MRFFTNNIDILTKLEGYPLYQMRTVTFEMARSNFYLHN